MKDKLQEFIRGVDPMFLIRVLIVLVLFSFVVIGLLFPKIESKMKSINSVTKTSGVVNVDLPSIVNGNLVLPKNDTGTGLLSDKLRSGNSLQVLSANLIAIFEQGQGAGQNISSIRIIGEIKNIGDAPVSSFQPVVRFINNDNKVVAQKTGAYSEGFQFHSLQPGEIGLYDATVVPPKDLPEKLEVILNADSATESAGFHELNIEGRNFEVKTASNSATGEKIEYYSVSGQIYNTSEDYLTDMVVTGWVKDKDGTVFSVNRQVFKNDLLAAGDKLDFKIPLIPLKPNFVYESYGLSAWGKDFKLKL